MRIQINMKLSCGNNFRVLYMMITKFNKSKCLFKEIVKIPELCSTTKAEKWERDRERGRKGTSEWNEINEWVKWGGNVLKFIQYIQYKRQCGQWKEDKWVNKSLKVGNFGAFLRWF